MTNFTKARTATELRDHVVALGKAFGIAVVERVNMPLAASGAGTHPIFGVAFIQVPPIADMATYAGAMHELGHHVHPQGSVLKSLGKARVEKMTDLDVARVKIEEERAAWDWARANAIDWDATADSVQRHAIGTYKDELASLEADALRPRTEVSRGDAARFFRTAGRFGAVRRTPKKPVVDLKTQPKAPEPDLGAILAAMGVGL
jgi:hypothetical protein